jgi:tripartite-type tricarboxylate transporter receptor subunit TctC
LKRARLLPDVPTIAEQGYPGFESVSWLGMLAPARVPRPIIDRLNKEIVALLQSPEVQKMVLAEGGETVPGTPEEFSAFLKSELPKWGQVIKRAGITVE